MEGCVLCSSCGIRTVQTGKTTCSTCTQRRSQPGPVLSPIGIRICALCGQSESLYVCICAFPLVDLCSVCRTKHMSSSSCIPHCVQHKTIGEFIHSAADYQRHIDRIDRIEAARSRLKAWCLATVEQAKVTITDVVKRLHYSVDEQQRNWLEMLRKTEENVNALESVLEEMKGDYCLRSGTFVDVCVENRREDLLQSLGTLVAYEIRDEGVCHFLQSIFAYQDNVPVTAPDRSNAPILDHSQVFSSRVSPNLSPLCTYNSIQNVPQVYSSYQEPSYQCTDPEACPAVCSNCQKYILPFRSQYSAADQDSICSCSERESPCAICQQPITDQSWTEYIAADMRKFIDSSKMVCSLQCFTHMCRLATASERPKQATHAPPQCLMCKKLIGPSYITLKCGHQFHDIKCFYEFLRGKSNNFQVSVNYFCEFCNTKIDFEVLDLFFGFASHMKTLALTQPCVCAVCRNCVAVLTTPCNHPICTNCAKKGNASCRICGMDSRCLLF